MRHPAIESTPIPTDSPPVFLRRPRFSDSALFRLSPAEFQGHFPRSERCVVEGEW